MRDAAFTGLNYTIVAAHYNNAECSTFVQDMKKAGFEVAHGCSHQWEGPIIQCYNRKDFNKALAATKIEILWSHTCGRFSIWSKSSGKLIA